MTQTSGQQMQREAKVDEMKGRLKEAWGDLTDDDVKQAEGQWDQMIATIREKTGESIETISSKVNELIDDAQDSRN